MGKDKTSKMKKTDPESVSNTSDSQNGGGSARDAAKSATKSSCIDFSDGKIRKKYLQKTRSYLAKMQHGATLLKLLGKTSNNTGDAFDRIIEKVSEASVLSWTKTENYVFFLALANKYTKKSTIKKIPLDKASLTKIDQTSKVLTANDSCDFAEDFFSRVYTALNREPTDSKDDPMHVNNPIGMIISKVDELTAQQKKKISESIEMTSTNIVANKKHKKGERTYFEKRDAEEAYSQAARDLRKIYSALNSISFEKDDYTKTIEDALAKSKSYDYREFTLTHEFLTHIHAMLNNELDSVEKYVTTYTQTEKIIQDIQKCVDEQEQKWNELKFKSPRSYGMLWSTDHYLNNPKTNEKKIAENLFCDAYSTILSNVEDVLIKTADPKDYIQQFTEQVLQSDNTDESKEKILNTLKNCSHVLDAISNSIKQNQEIFSEETVKHLPNEVTKLNTFITNLTNHTLKAMPYSISDHLTTFDGNINHLFLKNFDSIETFISSLQTFCKQFYSEAPIDYSPLTEEIARLITKYNNDKEKKRPQLYSMAGKIIKLLSKNSTKHYENLTETLKDLRTTYLKNLENNYYCQTYDYQDFDNAITTIDDTDLPPELKEQLKQLITLASTLADESNKNYIPYLKDQLKQATKDKKNMSLSERRVLGLVRDAEQKITDCENELETAKANRKPRPEPSNIKPDKADR